MDLLSYSGVFLHLRQTTLFAPYLPLHGRVEDEISVKLDEFLKLKGRKQEIRIRKQLRLIIPEEVVGKKQTMVLRTCGEKKSLD